jgi:hypothetical protein
MSADCFAEAVVVVVVATEVEEVDAACLCFIGVMRDD